MKRGLLLIALVGFLMISSTNKPAATQFFVQFKIFSISTIEEATTIDQKMKQKSGIEISRTDHVTSTYFCVLKAGADYTEEDFTGWMSGLGYEIGCFTKGVQGVEQMTSPHALKSCQP